MQFSTLAILATSAISASAITSFVTETDASTTLETITSCASEVTNCPARESSAAPVVSSVSKVSNVSNGSTPSVTSYEGAANGLTGQVAAAGFAALVAGALLGL